MRKGIYEERFHGDCLEALGIPDHGTAVIDADTVPRVFDIVFCDSAAGTAHGYLKQLLQTGESALVRTRYKDPKRDFLFHAATIMGVVIEMRDISGNVVYKRPRPTNGDQLRASTNEGIVEILRRETKHGCPKEIECIGDCHRCWVWWLGQEATP